MCAQNFNCLPNTEVQTKQTQKINFFIIKTCISINYDDRKIIIALFVARSNDNPAHELATPTRTFQILIEHQLINQEFIINILLELNSTCPSCPACMHGHYVKVKTLLLIMNARGEFCG